MRKYNVRLNFFWDDEDDVLEVIINTPNNVSVDDVNEALLNSHTYLDEEDESDIYGKSGRNPETLLDYVCEKYGWNWQKIEVDFDIDLNLP